MTMKKTILTVLLVAAATAQARFSESHIPLSSGTDANLQNNTIYDVNSDLTLSAAAGSSKFRVLGSNVVAINIKKDVTLTLKGGDATGETGAGAAISVASGATLDVGAGNTLRQSVLNAGGTLANGRLEVAKGLVVTPGQTMTVASGATLDLSAVTEVALKDASAAVPAGGWVIATSSSGGIVFGTSELKLTGALSGYTLFITPTQARIGKVGLTLTFY